MAGAPVNRTVNVFINQASAERSMQNLQKQSDKLVDSIKNGEKAGKDMTVELEKLAATKARMAELEGVISGKLAPSFNQVKARVAELARELNNMSSDAPGYAAKFKDFETVNQRFQEMKGHVQNVGKALEEVGHSSFWERVKEGFQTGLGIGAGLGVVQLIEKGIEKIKELFTVTTEKFSESEQINARLGAVLKSTGGAAGLAKEDLDTYAESLSKVTKFSVDTVKGGEALLLTFTEIGKDTFPKALEAALNLSEGLGHDLHSSILQIGKALQDPATGLTALKRVGVTFTDAQKAVITSLKDTGHVAEAQSAILDVLATKFGGVAAAAAATDSGALKQLDNRLEETEIKIGSKLLPIVAAFKLGIESLAIGFADAIGAIDHTNQALEEFHKQEEKVDSLDKNILPLIQRYDELTAKVNDVTHSTSLSQAEHIELNKAIAAIGNTIPGAITQFDAYGRAISISTEKAREYINLQKLILQERNRDAIKEQQDLEKQLVAQAQELQAALPRLQAYRTPQPGDVGNERNKFVDEELPKTQAALAKLQDRLQAVRGIIRELRGESNADQSKSAGNQVAQGLIETLQAQIKTLDDARPALQTIGEINKNLAERLKLQEQLDHLEGKKSVGDKAEDANLKKQKKALEDAMAFAQQLKQLHEDVNALTENSDEKELQHVRDKYNKLRQEAEDYFNKYGQHLQGLTRLDEDESRELKKLMDEQAVKHQSEIEKAQDAETAAVKRGMEERAAFAKRLASESIAEIKKQGKLELEAKKEIKEKVKALEIQAAQAIVTIVQSIVDQQYQDELAAEQKVNQQKLASLQKQLDNKVITQAQYNIQVNKLNQLQANKEKEIKHKQFVADKEFALAQAVINGAIGITQIWAKYGDIPYYAGILTAIEAAAVALQIGVIASKPEPKYAKGGIANGASHADGGISMVNADGRKVGEMEGGEAYMILSRETTRNNAALINSLLDASMNGGGRSVTPYLYQRQAPLNYGQAYNNMQYMQAYASGGVVAAANGNMSADWKQRNDATADLRDLLADIKANGIEAYMVYSKFDRKNKEATRLKQSGSLGATA